MRTHLDFKVTALVAVPEPSLVALLGAGALFSSRAAAVRVLTEIRPVW
jgi:hypothetical protein